METDPFILNMKQIYAQKGYFEMYGIDIFTSIIICIIFFILSSYFYILNNIDPIKANWAVERCSPVVIPFAGIINRGSGESVLDFTEKNFTGCVQTILTNITSYAFQPIYYIMNNLTSVFSDALNAVNAIRAEFNTIRISVTSFSTEVMGRTLNITIPISQMVISIKDMMSKIMGTFTASVFTLFGSFLTLKSFMLFIMELLTVILYLVLGTGMVMFGISMIPLFGAWAIPIVAVDLALMIAILVPTIAVRDMMSDVLSLSSRSLPKNPSCFIGNTQLQIKNKNVNYGIEINSKSINSVEIGDVLNTGEMITSVMKFARNGQAIYDNDGIFVTGEHMVCEYSSGGKINWIKIKDHERSIKTELNDEFVYCIGTNTKSFSVKNKYYLNSLFLDWDDITDENFKLIEQKVLNAIPEFKKQDIHYYLDNGLIGTTMIDLFNGNKVNISDIGVNDILANNVRVTGVIKIDGTCIKSATKYNDGEKIIIGVNLNLFIPTKETKEVKTYDVLYQLLTDSGYFSANGIIVRDYNYGIDKYL